MAAAPITRDVGSRRELFVDDWLIDRFDGAALRLHHPVPREAAITFDAPWEGKTCFYVTILEHQGEYRAYYRGSDDNVAHAEAVTAVAISRDGVAWERPTLGVVEWRGSRDNNIVLAGEASHTFAPCADANPAADPAARFKALAALRGRGRNRVLERWPTLIAYGSSDGVRWRELRPEPVIADGAFDSQNLAFWDTHRGYYVAFYRDFVDREGPPERRIRGIKHATSPDFLNWTDGAWLDYGDAPLEHFYTNATISYPRAPHIYMAFPKRYVPTRKVVEEHPNPGVSDGVFMTSRDGRRWDRTFRDAFLRPGRDPLNWTERNNAFAWGAIQTAPDELSLYWVEHYRQPGTRLRRGTLRVDGFASLHASHAGGAATTHPLLLAGDDLVVNFATSAAGSLRVEVQDAAGAPIPGFAHDDCPELYGDDIARRVRWAGGGLGALGRRPIRLRLTLRDADLYAIWAAS